MPFVLAGLGISLAVAFRVADRDAYERRAALGLGATLAFLSLTRPDGTLFTATICLGLVLARPRSRAAWKTALIAGSLSSAAFLALSLFRRVWFGAWVPNTSSKLTFSREHLELGWAHVTRDASLWTPLFVLAGLALVLAFALPASRRRLAIIAPSLLGWGVYVAAIGGDFMPERRHLVPMLFLLCAAAAEGVRGLAESSRRAELAAWHVGLVACALLFWSQRDDWAVADANNAEWYWRGRPIGLFFRQAFGDKDPLLAVDAAGALPYFWGQRSLDMLGLNDRYLATHLPADLDKRALGHGLGDGAYVLGRKPDLVVFHVPDGREQPMWRSGQEMARTQQFKQSYQLLYYVTPVGDVQGVAYVRVKDGKLAPAWQGSELQLPAWLFATQKTARATLDAAGRSMVRTPAATTLTFAHAPLRAGRCVAQIDADIDLALAVRAGARVWTAELGQALAFGLEAPQEGRIEVTTRDRAASLRAVAVRCAGALIASGVLLWLTGGTPESAPVVSTSTKGDGAIVGWRGSWEGL